MNRCCEMLKREQINWEVSHGEMEDITAGR